METFVALFRAINVGGHNKIPMAALTGQNSPQGRKSPGGSCDGKKLAYRLQDDGNVDSVITFRRGLSNVRKI